MPMSSIAAELAHLLGVPCERPHLEAVEQRDDAGASIRCGACSSRRCPRSASRAAWRSSESLELGGGVGSARAARRARRRAARPSSSRFGEHSHSRARVAVASRATSITTGPTPGGLQVERQLVVGAELAVELGEPGARRGGRAAAAAPGSTRSRRQRTRRTTASWTSTTSPSPVSQASDSSPVAPALEGPAEGRERVLGQLGPGPPVGEGDRPPRASTCGDGRHVLPGSGRMASE